MIKSFIYRLWQLTLVTAFVFIAVGCSRDLSHDPQAVDAITIDYITTDFKADVEAAEDIDAVESMTLTRQDYIPIIIVDYRIGEQVIRDFFAFSYEDLCKVRQAVERNPECSHSDIVQALGYDIWEQHAVAMKNIILRAKRGQLPKQ